LNTSKRDVPDFSVPSAARMYDYFLGGKDHFQADREAAEQVMSVYPEASMLARANRRFLTRAVWYLAEHGIRQYVDLGCGMPTSPAVHEIARQVRPDARVVYVDNDPVVATHCRFICHGDTDLAFVDGDICAPRDILKNWQLERTIDLTAPVAFLCAAVLHFVPGAEQTKGIVAALRSCMAPGSYVVISHALTDDASKDVLAEIIHVTQGMSSPPIPRTAEEIAGFFDGFDLIEPGLVDASQWRPDEQDEVTKIRFLAGLGRKP
jgi:O-methyltransferase involved in polyketide biosynthesis